MNQKYFVKKYDLKEITIRRFPLAMTIPSNGHTETDRHVKFDTAEPGIEFYFIYFFLIKSQL